MKNRINQYWLLIFILFAFLAMAGCGNSEEKNNANQTPAVSANQVPSSIPAASVPVIDTVKQDEPKDIAVSVDGSVLKKSVVQKSIEDKLNSLKGKIPTDKIKEARASIKKQIINEFIIRNLLTREVERRKIVATDQEIKAMMEQIKATLPPDKNLETFMKENKISKENIALGVKINKLVKQEGGKKTKPTQKEIKKFYDENKDKFVIPENVHVRHILIAFADGDNDKIKEEKKVKIEGLRKQIEDGADFAEVARKNSDCPSKDNGGDLGLVRKGETVKPFEDAAFSQKLNAVGPVVATEYGYHVIQVLERNPQKTMALEDVKGKISSYLEQQKQAAVFNALVNKLRENAKIIVYED